MNTHHAGKADFAALLELAEARFFNWHLKELRPERDRRMSKLSKLKGLRLTSAGRAFHAIKLYRELLEREVRRRIAFYAEAARESGNSAMFSKARLHEYRNGIMTSVGAAAGRLKDEVERDFWAAGDLSPLARPAQDRYKELEVEILDVVNAELAVLEAEDKRTGHAQGVNVTTPEPAKPSGGLAAEVNGVKARHKPGPKPDKKSAEKVLRIISSRSKGASWKSKLDDICMTLD